MKTKFVGMKEFRQNLAEYTNLAMIKGIRFIVLRKNKPVLDVRPANEAFVATQRLKKELEEAEKQVKRGEIYSHEEVMKELGLD